jgi:hypothetical protein
LPTLKSVRLDSNIRVTPGIFNVGNVGNAGAG